MIAFLEDTRFALRMLGRSPLFTAVAVTALGIAGFLLGLRGAAFRAAAASHAASS